jgi:hypothetical protein
MKYLFCFHMLWVAGHVMLTPASQLLVMGQNIILIVESGF